MATPTVSWDETSPAGTAAASQGDDRIRELKTQTREVVAMDHEMASSGQTDTTGYHKTVHLEVQTAPTAVANTGLVYTKDVNAVAELHFKDESANETQLSGPETITLPPHCFTAISHEQLVLAYAIAGELSKQTADTLTVYFPVILRANRVITSISAIWLRDTEAAGGDTGTCKLYRCQQGGSESEMADVSADSQINVFTITDSSITNGTISSSYFYYCKVTISGTVDNCRFRGISITYK